MTIVDFPFPSSQGKALYCDYHKRSVINHSFLPTNIDTNINVQACSWLYSSTDCQYSIQHNIGLIIWNDIEFVLYARKSTFI